MYLSVVLHFMANSTIVCAPVEESDRQILESNEDTIVKLMDPDRISKLLMDKGVIDTNDRKQILVPPVLGERNRLLLAKLLTRGPDAFKNYLNALTESRTKNHVKLHNLLQNDDLAAPVLPVEEKLADSRHRRTTEKIDNHERRLHALEEGVYEGRGDSDVESIRAELNQRHRELTELRQKLKTRDGELQEALEDNKAQQKRIQSLEKKIVTLETHIKEQKTKVESLQKHQQQDKRSIKALEEKNSKLESKMESAEKKMDKKLQDQEKRHQKDLEDIRHLLRHSAKLTGEGHCDGSSTLKGSSTSTKKTTGNTLKTRSSSCSRLPVSGKSSTDAGSGKAAAKSQNTGGGTISKASGITPKNRFQSEQSSSQTKFYPAPRAVQTWKKSSADPDKLPPRKRNSDEAGKSKIINAEDLLYAKLF